MENPNVETYLIPPGDWCPNSPDKPLLIYRRVLNGDAETMADEFESLFARNGWPPAWRYTVYDYPHYHSTSHEVIGVFRGEAVIRLGDAAGLSNTLRAGDVVLIPAGVSHQRLDSRNGFQGVGAYPEGCEVDEMRPSSFGRDQAWARVAKLPAPNRDPVFGEPGPRAWP